MRIFNREDISTEDIIKYAEEKGIVINEKDISELGDYQAYTCKKHPELALRIYHKRKLIVCSLFEIVKDKLNQKD